MLKISDNYAIIPVMQITELAAKVQSLGLNDKEARVYVAALFLGPSPVQKIAEQADINRATAYVILDQLADLGLVSQSTEGKKTVFVAEPPEALERVFDRQKEIIEDRRKELKQLLPELKEADRVTSSTDAPVVRFYKGKEGISAISADMRRKARRGSTIYAMSNYDEVVKVFPDVFKSSPNTRLKKKLSSNLLYSYSEEVKSDKALLREAKRFPEKIKADINLYEDRAALLSYSDNAKDLTGIVIESPAIVGALRQLFEQAWSNNKSK